MGGHHCGEGLETAKAIATSTPMKCLHGRMEAGYMEGVGTPNQFPCFDVLQCLSCENKRCFAFWLKDAKKPFNSAFCCSSQLGGLACRARMQILSIGDCQQRWLPVKSDSCQNLKNILERRLLSVSCRDSLMVFRWIVDPNFQLHMAFCVACWPFLRGSEKNSREQWWGWTTGPLDMAWAGPASLFWAGWWLTWCPVALPGPGGSEDSSILEARGSCQMAVQGAGQTVMSKPSKMIKMYTPKSGAKFMTFPGLRASSFSWGT